MEIMGTSGGFLGVFALEKRLFSRVNAKKSKIFLGAWKTPCSLGGNQTPLMNHILKLQTENREQAAKLENIRTAFNEFSAFLASAKFQTKEGGERQDWIATGDVQRWLSEVKSENL